MAKYSNTVEYNIVTKLDASGISKLQTEIRQVENELREMSNYNMISPTKAEQAKRDLRELRHLINDSFNGQLGMFDLTAFNKSMKTAGISIKSLGESFSLAGSKGQVAFNSLIGRIGQIDTGIKSMSSTTNKIATTLGNTARWGLISTAFQSVLTSAHEATRYISDLDQSLTNIMMVTDYSRENMNDFARSANEAAKALGSTTTAYTDATLVFAQQGYDIPQSQQLANMSIKLANVSQQDSATTSDQITAYMNAYGMDKNMEQLNDALGKWAQVANDSAADVEELATATQKSASTANTVGVSMDQLNATIATIESVTKDAPENIGNGLKTIYARFSDIKMGETLDDGVNLGQVTGALSKVGINALDENGNMKEVGNILEELMGVWDGMNRTQKAAIATTLAGKYQLSRFEALMNRSDLYRQYLNSSETSGAENMEEMYDDYLNSMEGKTKTLQASIEGLFTNIFDTDDLYGFIEGLTSIVDLLGKMTQSLGDGQVLLTGLGAIGTKVFSNQIGQAATNLIKNIQTNQLKKNNQKAAEDTVKQLGLSNIGAQNQDIIDFAKAGLENSKYMSKEQQEQYNDALRETIQIRNQLIQQEEELEATVLQTNTALATQNEEQIKIIRSKSGKIEGIDDSELKRNYGNDALLNTKNDKIQAQKNLDELSNSAVKASQAMSALDQAQRRTTAMTDAAKESYEDLSQKLKEIGITDAADLEIAFENVSQYFKDVTINSEDANIAIAEYLKKVQEISRNTDIGINIVKSKSYIDNYNDVSGTQEADTVRAKANEGMQKTWDTQKTISDMANVISAIGQMGFAWQSFQSLGPLWTNDDIELGDKIIQSLMNVSMTLPMLISGYQTLNDFIKTNTSLQQSNSIAARANALAFEQWSVSTRAQQLALTGLSKALSFLNGKLLPLTIGIMAVSTAISFAQSAYSEYKKEIADTAREASESSKKIIEQKNSFDELYTSYQAGKTSSFELKNSVKELNDSLKDQELNALSAAGAWDEYSNKLNEVQTKELKEKLNNINASLNSDEKINGINKTEEYYNLKANKDAAIERRDSFDVDSQAYKDANQAVTNINNQISKNYDDDFLNNIESAQKIFYEINKNNSELQYNGKDSYQDYLEKIQNTDIFKKQMAQEGVNPGSRAAEDFAKEYVNSLMADTSISDATRKKLGEAVKNSNKENKNDIGNLSSVKMQDENGNNIISSEDLTTLLSNDKTSEGMRNALLDALKTAVADANNLSEDEKIQLTDLISSDTASIEQILSNVIGALDTGNIIDQYKSGNMIDDNGQKTFLDEDMKSLSNSDAAIEKYDIKDSTIQSYKALIESSEDLKNQTEELNKAVEEEGDSSDNASKRLNKLDKMTTDMAEDAIKSQKAMDKLVKNISDWSEAIEDGDKSSAEYIESMSEMKDTVGDLLDVDLNNADWGDQFVEDNLDLIKNAAAGDIEALQELQSKAAQQIIVDINKTGNLTPENLDLLNNKANELANLDIEVGADLDDQGFIDTCNEMMANGQMTADQVQSYFDSLGYEANIETVTDTHTTTLIPSIPLGPIAEAAKAIGLQLPSSIGPVTWTSEVSVPKIVPPGGSGGSGSGVKKKSSAKSTAPKSSGGGKGGGGGGGGGKSSTIEDNTKKEIDIYEEVNETLERVGNQYDKINDYADRLYGNNRISAIQKAINKEKEYSDVLQQKLSIQQQELNTLKEMDKDINDNPTIHSFLGDDAFNEDGSIIYSAYEDKYNELFNKIKSFDGTDQEANKDAYEQAKEDLENYVSAINAWYEALNNRDSLIKEMDDAWYAMQDAAADAIDEFYDMTDAMKDLNDNINKINDVGNWVNNGGPGKIWTTELIDAFGDIDNVFNELLPSLTGEITKGIANNAGENARFWSEEYQRAYGDSETAQAYKDAVDAYHSISLDFNSTADEINAAYDAMMGAAENAGLTSGVGLSEADLIDRMYQAVDDYTEAIEDQKDAIEDLWDAMEGLIDTINDQMDRQLENFDNIADKIDTRMDMVDILYGDKAYDERNGLLQAQNSTLYAKVEDIASSIGMTQDILDKMKENGEEDTELYQQEQDKLLDYQDQMYEVQGNILENTQAIYENMVNQNLDNWANGILNVGDLDWYETQWDLITRNSDQYLDDVNRAFEIQKLQSQYNTLLDDANDLGIQQKITNQMEQQLAYLREKTNLSQYDVAYAQAQLEILQKQIALEEAQANKSQMKLKRDTQGNYRYVYAAKEGDVENAQSDLLEAQNNAYNLSKDALVENQENAVQAVQDAKATLLEIMTDASLSAKERANRVQFVVDQLKEYLNGISEDIGDISNNLLADVQNMGELLLAENEGHLTDILDSIVNGNEDAWREIDDRFNTSVLNALDKYDVIEERTDEMYQELLEDMDIYEQGITAALDITGDNLENYISNSIADAVSATQDLIDVSNELFDVLSIRASEVFDASDAVSAYTKTLNATNASYQDTINNLKNELQAANDQISAYETEKKRAAEEAAAKEAAKKAASGSGGGGGLKAGAMIGFNGRYYSNSWGGGPSGSMYSGRAGAVRISSYSGTPYGYQSNHGGFAIHIETPSGGPLGWIKPEQAFDTGGYTGTWNDAGVDGKGGKVAVLHQKELVLSEGQTRDILSAVELVNQMRAQAFSIGGNQLFSQVGRTGGDTIEQRVQIDATFPAAEDASEIKRALESLADNAYQYANRAY